jgi:Na+-transporting NADH:ubiquinone oxidoreductase subunit C
MQSDSVKRTFVVAFFLCLFCSVLVSGAAVLLKEKQIENKKLDIKKNLLIASGLLSGGDASKEVIESKFKRVKTIVVDLELNEIMKEVDPESFEMRKNAKDPSKNINLDPSKDIAKVSNISKLSKIYLVSSPDGSIEKVVLPVHGKGLWSTLYGFLALDKDKRTIKGLGFYEHGETPGLGGEVDNPEWKKIWVNKTAYDDSGKPTIKIVKGAVDPNNKNANSMVDGLSGATITGNGVQALVNFWLSDSGYGKVLDSISLEGAI